MNSKGEIGFWKAVGLTIVNKEAKNGNRTAFLLAEIMCAIFNVMAILGVLFAIAFVVGPITFLDWNIDVFQQIIRIIFMAMSAFTSLVISLIFRGIANDIGAEKDRNYITTLFFGFTSLVSLIVALVALFKGVG